MKYYVTVNGNKYEVEVESENNEIAMSEESPMPNKTNNINKVSVEGIQGEIISAPMPGKIVSIKVSEGESVKKNDVLLVLEAMKMENEIVSPKDGIITNIFVNKNDTVNPQEKLLSIK